MAPKGRQMGPEETPRGRQKAPQESLKSHQERYRTADAEHLKVDDHLDAVKLWLHTMQTPRYQF